MGWLTCSAGLKIQIGPNSFDRFNIISDPNRNGRNSVRFWPFGPNPRTSLEMRMTIFIGRREYFSTHKKFAAPCQSATRDTTAMEPI